jgi:hypothetical protein
MSQWHARDGIPDGNAYNVIFHVPIPSANNRVGINYQAALIASGIGGTTAMAEGAGAGQITTAEKALIASGALLEVAEVFNTNPGETASALTVRVNARYTALADVNGAFLANLKRRLDYWGGASAS